MSGAALWLTQITRASTFENLSHCGDKNVHLLLQLFQLTLGQPTQEATQAGAAPVAAEAASAAGDAAGEAAGGAPWTSEAWEFIRDIAWEVAIVFVPILIALLVARIVRARLRTIASVSSGMERDMGIQLWQITSAITGPPRLIAHL